MPLAAGSQIWQATEKPERKPKDLARFNPVDTGDRPKGKGSLILGSLSVVDENLVYDCEPSLRFSVGRSSSVLLSVPLPVSVEGLSAVARRSVGRSLLSLSFCTLWRFWMDARRPFTSSNSEVSTMYSGRAGRTVFISCCAAATRFGVMG